MYRIIAIKADGLQEELAQTYDYHRAMQLFAAHHKDQRVVLLVEGNLAAAAVQPWL